MPDADPYRLTTRERLMDLLARFHRSPPECETCGDRMVYRSFGAGGGWGWACPHELRADHLVDVTVDANGEGGCGSGGEPA